MAPFQTLLSVKRTWPLKMDGWNTTFLLRWPIFRCYVSFREGKEQKKNLETNDVALKCSSQYTNAISQPYRSRLQLKLILETLKFHFKNHPPIPSRSTDFPKTTRAEVREGLHRCHTHMCGISAVQSPNWKVLMENRTTQRICRSAS